MIIRTLDSRVPECDLGRGGRLVTMLNDGVRVLLLSNVELNDDEEDLNEDDVIQDEVSSDLDTTALCSSVPCLV